MGIIAWLVLGLIAGWLASVLVDGRGFGLLGDIVIGIIGAFIGGFVASALLGWDVTGFNLSSLILAVLGSVILLLIVKAVAPRRTMV
ncbi:MAG TPA: GlsB/YeaQ/YmgE family stress response membrane protein [Chloroflexota bacterium]